MSRYSVVYPIFIQCAEMIFDYEIKSIFLKLAHNTPPKNIKITQLCVIVSKKKINHHNQSPIYIINNLIPVLKEIVPSQNNLKMKTFKEPSNYKDIRYKTERKFYLIKKILEQGEDKTIGFKVLNKLQDKHFISSGIELDVHKQLIISPSILEENCEEIRFTEPSKRDKRIYGEWKFTYNKYIKKSDNIELDEHIQITPNEDDNFIIISPRVKPVDCSYFPSPRSVVPNEEYDIIDIEPLTPV